MTAFLLLEVSCTDSVFKDELSMPANYLTVVVLELEFVSPYPKRYLLPPPGVIAC